MIGIYLLLRINKFTSAAQVGVIVFTLLFMIENEQGGGGEHVNGSCKAMGQNMLVLHIRQMTLVLNLRMMKSEVYRVD